MEKWADVMWVHVMSPLNSVMNHPAIKYVDKSREYLSDRQLLKTHSDQISFLSVEW